MSKHILVIDDNKEVSRGLQHLLESEGYRVTTALKDEAEEVAAVAPLGDPIDLILMDVSGEGEEGYRRCRALRDRLSGATIILMTGATLSEADKQLGFEAGADGFIPRPENFPEIVDYIAERLRFRRTVAPAPGPATAAWYRATCPECGLAVRVSPTAITAGRAKVSCPQCNYVFGVAAESLARGAGPAAEQQADRGQLILVVEDTEFFRTYVTEVLEGAGFRVEAVQDGRAALEYLDRARPDLVLTDLLLPGIHGFDLCRYVKERTAPRPVPVIMMTGVYKSVQYQVEAQLKYKADDFLVKPFKPEDLVAKILRLLQRASA
ncbi:MAG: response regulator [candidate division NC10 bacterium]|nr:response regulator [candidate division NC10 bacterium]